MMTLELIVPSVSNTRLSTYFVEEYFPMHKKCTVSDFKSELSSRISNVFDYNFSNSDLLLEALTHKSFSHESSFDLTHNERLEFLGDSVLGLVVSDICFKLFPSTPEGELSKLRSTLVNEEILSHIALMNKLDQYILLGKGEIKNKGYEKKSVLSDCFEAIIGAIYLDSSFEIVKSTLENIFSHYESIVKVKLFDLSILNNSDPKSSLQELTMREFRLIPKYISEEVTIDKIKHFKVTATLGETILLTETNISKKKAMQNLAANILKNQLYNKARA